MRAMQAVRRTGSPTAVPTPRRLAAALLLGATAACAGPREPAPSLSAVMPSSAYNDAPVALTLEGDDFRPTYQVDARSGSATLDTLGFRVWMTPSGVSGASRIDLTSVLWQSLQLLAAELPAGTPPGPYDVTVADPRGRSWTQPLAFQSLGPDLAAPQVRIVSPPANASFAVGAQVPIVVIADDGAGAAVTGLTAVMWSGSGARQPYTCPVTGQSTVTCAFTLTAPGAASTPDQLIIEVTATDAAGQIGDARGQFDLVRAPAFNSLSPTAGSTLGQSQVFIEGAGLMQRNVDVRFDDLAATIVGLGPNSLQVSTPPHPMPGTVSVSVTIAGVTVRKDNAFTYVAPPVVRNVVPSSGPASGGFPVTIVGDNFLPQTTQIYFGSAPLRCPRYSSSNRIDGIAPPGTGTQAVIADDSIAGIYAGKMMPFRYYVQDAGLEALDGGPNGDAGSLAPDAGADDAGCPGAP
jgi:hypothetical protein